MIQALTLTLTLTLSLAGAPADLAAVPAVDGPAPVRCADATLGAAVLPAALAMGDIGAAATCNVSEDCDDLPDIGCSGTTCNAVSRDCSIGRRGYVECDGNRTWCSEPCPECTEEDVRVFDTGNCCPGCNGTAWKEFQECIDGQWVTQSSWCGPSGGLCPICP